MTDSAHSTLLVTGAAGFIGSSFVGMAMAQGYHVVVLDALTYAGHRENLQWIPHQDRLELVVGSIVDGTLVSRLLEQHQPQAIINFAAESHVDNSISRPGEFIETNIMGCYSLLEAARAYWGGLSQPRKEAFRFVHVSTDEVYGSLGETGKFTESSPMLPNSPYSASKAAGDMLCRAWFHTYHLPTIVTNCTNNYGPRQHPEKLIPRMITCALQGEPLPVYGDGRNVRDWIQVEDHCHGVMLALTKGIAGETYAFGGDAERTNIEVVSTICQLLDVMKPRADGQSYKEQIAFVTDRPGHDRRYAIDDSKSQQMLGFTRNHTFESGLQSTIEWYLNNTAWAQAVCAKKAA
ncbi:MAG: dTDP-glucose 4,6-dehydratase [Rickettsiales bacterium]|nr:dTDP-glucose 4,6-dehydratase [Rickettsiales bacterium]